MNAGAHGGETTDVLVSARGVDRWLRGHPWIYRSDVVTRPATAAGVVRVRDVRGRPVGVALWSPASEISLRLLDRDPDAVVDAAWWRRAIGRALRRREVLQADATAYRLVHGEGDGLPSLVVDRYDRWLVVQLMSAGLEAARDVVVDALVALTGAEGVLARNDAALRSREDLPRETVVLRGAVPTTVEVSEYGVRYVAAPWTGQKTGAFLDQRENRRAVGQVARGRALDCFSYHGSFALHLARRADSVLALDSSRHALERAAENVRLNGFPNVETREANAFDYLRDAERAGERFDTIVLDPPAFAKTRGALDAAVRGYKEINLRGMRLLAPGGVLYTASCSFHLSKADFVAVLTAAAADSGRRVVLRELRGQPLDHPEVLTIPETGYIKGAFLEALD